MLNIDDILYFAYMNEQEEKLKNQREQEQKENEELHKELKSNLESE